MTDRKEKVRPQRVGEVWVRRESDEAAIYDLSTGSLHRLNPSALAIWELCDGETTLEEMAEAIDELTQVGLDASRSSVWAAVQQLESAGLVKSTEVGG